MGVGLGIGLAAGGSVLGAALGAYSQYRAGQQESQVLRNNAQLTAWQRADTLRLGAAQAGAIRTEGSQIAASQTAAMAANGVDVTTGSPSDLLGATAAETERQVAIAKSNAAREAWGLRVEEQSLRSRARTAREQGILGAVGTGLSGLGNAGGTVIAGKR